MQMKVIKNFLPLFNKKQNLYILLALGIIILIATNFLGSDNEVNSKTDASKISIDYQGDADKLSSMLSKVSGAGKTEVMITYENGGEKVALQNSKINRVTRGKASETDVSTEMSEEKETVINGSGATRNPYIIEEKTPRVRGVLVVAEGGGDKNVKYEITNAVAAVLDVPYYRIQVLKKAK